MRRRLPVLAVAALLLTTACVAESSEGAGAADLAEPGESSGTVEPTATATLGASFDASEQRVRPFSRRRAMRHVRRLAGRIGARAAGSRGDRRARRYVRGKLERWGYRTRAPRVALPQGGWTRNVVARWPGSTPRLVLGAHLDTVPGSPGANDNASGVAVLLELARIMARSEEARNVRLVAFGAEERQPGGSHHLGSAAYVRTMTPRARSHFDLMTSVDMIGKPRTIIVGWTVERSRAVRELMQAARQAGVSAESRRVGDISDHGPFEKAGLAAAMLWTGFEPNHHQPTDRVRNVKPRALQRAGRLLRTLVMRA